MKLRVTVDGVAYDVDVEVLEDRDGVMHGSGPAMPSQTSSASMPVRPPQKVVASAAPAGAPPVAGQTAPAPVGVPSGPALTSPIPGTIVEVLATVGQNVKLGEAVLVIDAMKMHTQITANQDGTIKAILVKPGEVVQMGQALLVYDA